jgi:electron transfer flavoprotein alpha subunit
LLNSVWIVAEQRLGNPTASSLEVATAASALAGSVEAFSWGEGAAGCASALGACGVGRLFDLGGFGESLAGRRVAATIAARASEQSLPDAVLLPTSYECRDVAARLSVMIDRPVLANIAGLVERDGGLETSHEILGGTEQAKARVTDGGCGIYLIRAKSFAVDDTRRRDCEVVTLEPPPPEAADMARVTARHVEAATGPSLDEASVVVSGGRGLGAAENYRYIEELAGLLGGAPAASRAIVDAGWVPYANQVGQTGKTVKPDLYMAFGISGAMQHLVGMKGAKRIVAVNKDRSAPIFELADLGVVADANRVLPALIEAVRESKEQGA